MGRSRGHNTKLLLAALLVPKFSNIEIFGTTQRKRDKNEKEFENVFERFGLNAIKKKVDSPSFVTYYTVGKEKIPEHASSYLTSPVETPPDLPRYHTEYGRLMGIPDTAIEAFKEKKTFLNSDTAPYSDEVKSFKWFGISKDHWKEESKKVEEFAHKVKGISPALYDLIMSP